MRRCLLCVMLSLLTLAFPMRAVTISPTARGASAPDGGGDFTDMGSYFAGMTTNAYTPAPGPYPGGNDPWRDWFEFAIPDLTGSLVGASLALYQPPVPCPDCLGGFAPADYSDPSETHTFLVYGLGAGPFYFGPNDSPSFANIGAGTYYGSVTLNAGTDGTTVDISLNASALADIESAQGGVLYLGGVDSAETLPSSTNWIGDWNATSGADASQLDLDIAPEPASWLMMLGALGLAVPAMRRARHI